MAKTRTKERRKKLSAKKWAKDYKTGSGSFSFKIPDGMERFELKKAGVVRIDIIPYVAGKGNPYADEGEMHWERTYFAHKNVGPNNESYICPNATLNKKCPICEHRSELAQDPDTERETTDALKPKQRQLWNVYDRGEPEKGVQIFDISNHFFGKLLKERIENEDEDEDISSFADPEEGMTLKLTVVEESFKGRSFYKVAAIDFKPRKEPLSEEILEQAACLDDLLQPMSYKDLKKAFMQEGEEEGEEEDNEDEDEKPKKKRSRRDRDDDTDDDEDDVRSSRRRRQSDEDDEDEDEEAPRKRRRSR